MKILLADDEESIGTLIECIVQEAGHELVYAADGAAALELYRETRPDLIILDIMMPKVNGFEACKTIRDDSPTIPIIFLSAKGDIVDKSVGFLSGADDYLVKPFLPQELLLRINALARRSEAHRGSVQWAGRARCGNIEVDFKGRQVFVEGKLVAFTPKEFHLLHALIDAGGDVVTKEQLINDIWGEGYAGETSNIAVLVRRVREKIESDPSNPKHLLTVWHTGYKLVP